MRDIFIWKEGGENHASPVERFHPGVSIGGAILGINSMDLFVKYFFYYYFPFVDQKVHCTLWNYYEL